VGTEDFDDWVRRGPSGLFVDSHVDGLSGTTDCLPPASVHDLDLRLLHDNARRGSDLHAAVLDGDGILARGLEAIAARRSDDFTRFDGNLAGHTVADLTERVLSPTSLERWAACPSRWLFGDVLGLSELDRPEDVVTLDPLDRGKLVHGILEDFLQGVIDDGGIPPDHQWTVDDHRRLQELARYRFDEFERQGVVGKSLTWRHQRRVLLAELAVTLQVDGRTRAEHGSEPFRTEMAFGMEGLDPLPVPTPSGRTLHFRGMADRVDRGPGGRLVVLDYKTGGSSDYSDITDEDPFAGGTHLQLPTYGLAARQQVGDPGAPVHAAYWFVSGKGEWAFIGYDLDDDVLERFGETVDTIADGIEHGVFPARPGEYNSWWASHDNCGFCDFDRLCRYDRLESWERKRDDPGMAVYVRLAEPDDPDDLEGDDDG
jgi:RecB family exonuclease